MGASYSYSQVVDGTGSIKRNIYGTKIVFDCVKSSCLIVKDMFSGEVVSRSKMTTSQLSEYIDFQPCKTPAYVTVCNKKFCSKEYSVVVYNIVKVKNKLIVNLQKSCELPIGCFKNIKINFYTTTFGE